MQLRGIPPIRGLWVVHRNFRIQEVLQQDVRARFVLPILFGETGQVPLPTLEGKWPGHILNESGWRHQAEFLLDLLELYPILLV